MASLAIFTHTPTLRCSLCPAARVAKARQVGVGTVRVRVPPSPSSCKGVAESRGAGRRALVVGSVVGTAVLVGSAAVAVVAAARAMATSGGGREAAVLATRRGMQLFSQGDVKGSVVEFDKALELDPRQRPCAVINFAG